MTNSDGLPAGAEVELVGDLAALEPLHDRWRELAVARSNAFITPEWFECWMRHYGDRDDPLVAVVRERSDRVAGLLPLVLSGPSRLRLARFAGSALGDHFEPVASPEHEAEVARIIGEKLGSSGSSGLVLENVDADATWWRALSRAGGYAASPLVDRQATLPRIVLDGRSFDEYLSGQSRNFRSQLGRKRRALERDHAARYRWTREPGEVAADMATLFRLHAMRWEGRAGSSALAAERVRALLADFAARTMERGWLRLCVLEADGEAVAAWFGWRVGGRFAYYQAGFDPRWGDRSVGLLLLAETVRMAAEEGAHEYDMLLGDEPFKARFADSERHVSTAMIAPRRSPARMLAATEARLREASHRLPDGVRETAKRAGRGTLERLPLARRR